MRQDLREKFNSVKFEGLEHVLCGDALYYVEYGNKGIKTTVKSYLRILTSILMHKCDVQADKESKVLFLFSNSYGNRKDMRRWFNEICELVEHKMIVTPGTYVLTLSNLKRIKAVTTWFKKTRDMGMERGERIYYLSRLLSSASDVWYIQDIIKKRQMSLNLFVSTCDVHAIDSVMTQHFNLNKITTVSLQHGAISRKANEWTITGSKSKYYLIYGEFTKQQAIKAGVSEEKLISVGMPQHTKKKFVERMQSGQTNEFGLILDGIVESDIKKIKLADEFAKKNNITYKVKLHPGSGKESYGEILNSDSITDVFINEINVDQFSEMIDFALLGWSVVFMEYTLKLLPVFVHKESEEDDIYEGIDWCKVTDIDSMQALYDRLINDKDAYEKDLKDTRAYLCECENVAQNYREFFEKYSK